VAPLIAIDDTLVVSGSTMTVNDDTLAVGSGTLTVDDCTMTVDDDTSMIDDPFVVGSYTLTSVGGTQTVNDNTLMVGGGTQMSDDQHQRGSAVTSMTRFRRHQAKQHPHILHATRDRVGFNKDHCSSCADQGRKSLPPYFTSL
jgi:hypothetical protein